ncbi:serine hydrolase [Pararhodonellum marinum]|uniref:serine hydrolase n=1 Tax=Pararhodonellum marinum TaxID=2755358 RepID=UPI00188F48C6|nr:serine hydrolase [Pararhodonellum marinum]
MKKILFRIAGIVLLAGFFQACSQEKQPFQEIEDDFPALKNVLEQADKYPFQIIYTQVIRDRDNQPTFEDFPFNLDENKYFYPASTVKLPVALLALEWLNEINVEGLSSASIMLTDSVRPSQIPALVDSTSETGTPSIAHYVKKILLVSDNDAYNRLYELLGQDYINAKLNEKGFKNTLINHRLSMPMSDEENRHFNPVRFLNNSGELLLQLPARKTEEIYSNPNNPKLGESYYSAGELVESPMDFTYKNRFSLEDMQGVMKRLIFPDNFPESQRFHLLDEDREMVLQYMSMVPGESQYPSYDKETYYDSYSKFYKFGTNKEPIPENFRIFNKTGMAYGHLLDYGYFVDFDNQVEFLVSAVIYVNENNTLNDNDYQYEEVGFPFYRDLGEYLYQFDLNRKRRYPAELNSLRYQN